MHQTIKSRCHNLHNTETQPYQTQKHVLLLVTSRKCAGDPAHATPKEKNQFPCPGTHGMDITPFLNKYTQENDHVPTSDSLSAAQKLPTSSW